MTLYLFYDIDHAACGTTVTPMKPEGSIVIKVDASIYVKLMIWDTVGMERLFNTIPDQ